MAYAYTVTGPTRLEGGAIGFVVVETDVGASDVWTIDASNGGNVPADFTIVLDEVALTDADAASTVRPERATGDNASLTADRLDYLYQADAAAASARLAPGAQGIARQSGGELHGKSVPDDHANEITTRITMFPRVVL